MVRRIERTRNTNTAITNMTAAITLNAATSTILIGANSDRLFFSVSLDIDITTRFVYIKLQAASTDNDAKGILLYRDFTGNDNAFFPRWEMPIDNIYTGEISAITDSGGVDVFITEY